MSDFKQLYYLKFKLNPTPTQAALVTQLEFFTYSENKNCLFILRGYAGTGKTSILGAFVKTLDDLKFKTKLLAPTGRAAKILSLNSKKQAFTIHKHIYRQKNKSDVYNSLELTKNLHRNTIFIVDEASMIGEYSNDSKGNISERNLLSDLIEYVFSGEKCKLILLGDEGQLPPVGSTISPALDKDFLTHHFIGLTVSEFQLTEVLRQEQSSLILENATSLRNSDKINFPQLILDERKDFQNIEGDELQEKIEQSISQYGEEEVIIITRSNKNANLYNQQFRSRILWFEEELSNNDLLINVKNNYFWLDEASSAGFIANGEILKVKRVLKRELLYGFEFIRVIVELIDYPDISELEIIILKEALETDGASLSRERLKELFFEIEKDYLHEKNKKKRYELILKNPYFNALQVKFAYAITCHKSQGGQWKTVFIDPGFIPEEQMDENYYRWLYTAITRAKEQVYLINFSPKYFTSNLTT